MRVDGQGYAQGAWARGVRRSVRGERCDGVSGRADSERGQVTGAVYVTEVEVDSPRRTRRLSPVSPPMPRWRSPTPAGSGVSRP